MARTYRNFLPLDMQAEHVVACLGLISDTHMPLRCLTLPPVLRDILRQVDLILHAGDVSELAVLDELGRIAPVIAVQGNDESPQIKDTLPFQQVIAVGGKRILLCHSHHPNVATELSMRAEDRWQPKLQYRLELGQRLGAPIVVFGHTHVPMTYEQDGVLLINPGALASASAFTRQLRKTIALLVILDHGSSRVIHIDLDSPQHPFLPQIDWQAGFRAALDQYSESIIEPELRQHWQAFEAYMRALTITENDSWIYQTVYLAILQIARRCWANEQRYIRRMDVQVMLDELAMERKIPEQILAGLRAQLR